MEGLVDGGSYSSSNLVEGGVELVMQYVAKDKGAVGIKFGDIFGGTLGVEVCFCKRRICGDVSPLLRSKSRFGTLVREELAFHVLNLVWKKRGVVR